MTDYTISEKRMGIGCNLSEAPEVAQIRKLNAEIHALLESIKNPGYQEGLRLIEIAQKECEGACMWAVKAATA